MSFYLLFTLLLFVMKMGGTIYYFNYDIFDGLKYFRQCVSELWEILKRKFLRIFGFGLVLCRRWNVMSNRLFRGGFVNIFLNSRTLYYLVKVVCLILFQQRTIHFSHKLIHNLSDLSHHLGLLFLLTLPINLQLPINTI